MEEPLASIRLHIGARLSIVVLLITGALAATALAGDAGGARYAGHFVGEKETSKVEVKAVSQRGKPRHALVRVRGLLIVCDDGTRLRQSYEWFRVPFVNPKLFVMDAHTVDTDFARLLVVRGRLVRGGREMRGYVNEARLYDPHVPHGDCATLGRERWRAKRR